MNGRGSSACCPVSVGHPFSGGGPHGTRRTHAPTVFGRSYIALALRRAKPLRRCSAARYPAKLHCPSGEVSERCGSEARDLTTRIRKRTGYRAGSRLGGQGRTSFSNTPAVPLDVLHRQFRLLRVNAASRSRRARSARRACLRSGLCPVRATSCHPVVGAVNQLPRPEPSFFTALDGPGSTRSGRRWVRSLLPARHPRTPHRS